MKERELLIKARTGLKQSQVVVLETVFLELVRLKLKQIKSLLPLAPCSTELMYTLYITDLQTNLFIGSLLFSFVKAIDNSIVQVGNVIINIVNSLEELGKSLCIIFAVYLCVCTDGCLERITI